LEYLKAENSALQDQLLSKIQDLRESAKRHTDLGGEDKRLEDRYLEKLKKNHDIVLEKYEHYRSRNELLEKEAAEKERLYREIKLECESLADEKFRLARLNEDFGNQKHILEQKVKVLEEERKKSEEEQKGVRESIEELEE